MIYEHKMVDDKFVVCILYKEHSKKGRFRESYEEYSACYPSKNKNKIS